MPPKLTDRVEYEVPPIYASLIPDDDLPINQLLDFKFPSVQSTLSAEANIPDLFSFDPPITSIIPFGKIPVPPLDILVQLHARLSPGPTGEPSLVGTGYCSLRGLDPDGAQALPFWVVSFWIKMTDAIQGQRAWKAAIGQYHFVLANRQCPPHLSHVPDSLETMFGVLGWNVLLVRETSLRSKHLTPLFSPSMLSGTLLDSVLIVFRMWVANDLSLPHTWVEILDFQYPFTLSPSDFDWDHFNEPQHGPRGDPLAHLRSLAKKVEDNHINVIVCPLHSGIQKHYSVAKVDFEKNEVAFGDSLRWAMKPRDRKGLTCFFRALHKNEPQWQSLASSDQDDAYSCGDLTWNTVERTIWPHTRPWQGYGKALECMEYALILATQCNTLYDLADFGLSDDIILARHDGRRATTGPIINDIYDDGDTDHFDPDPRQRSDSDDNDMSEGDLLPHRQACRQSRSPSDTSKSSSRSDPSSSLTRSACAAPSLDSFVQRMTRQEAEERRLATKSERLEEEAEARHFALRKEELRKIEKADHVRVQGRERQRAFRERAKAQKKAVTAASALSIDAVLGQGDSDPSSSLDDTIASVAERSRPYRTFKVDQRATRDTRGRKRKHEDTCAEKVNWTNSLLWDQIVAAGRMAGPCYNSVKVFNFPLPYSEGRR
ncbi:hypothetical protein OF83DRAFT_1172146 [Amylostereum chailletii]|nr:hypothetical protein OF83DRAFT_1172146 [Amylostereum chailletii]